MSERSLKLLHDAVAAIEAAQLFMGHSSYTDYAANHQLRSAVERQLEILGEACAQLDKLNTGWREKIADLGLAIGLRNRIIHGYDEVDDAMVFETVQRDLPGLHRSILGYLPVLGLE
jgi:uncharacterized protein with HEPN domain